jgi:uncharacterized surface protein with fasciclin (FAS1) repeats
MKINNQFSSVLFAALLGATISTSSCKKDDDTPPPVKTNTITDVVVGNASFSILKEAVTKADLAATLSSAGPFTVFAPDNAAFASAGITSATVGTKTKAELSELLLYHTLPGKILAAGVPAGPNAKVTTAGGDSVFVTKNAAGVFVNGIKVAVADIAADNGVIHQLSKALNKPAAKIVPSAQATAGLDSLVKAIVRVNTASPGLIDLINGNILTVFAPNNLAFTNLLKKLTLTDINQIPLATLSKVLAYHLVAGRAFSSDLANGDITMFAGGKTTVNLTNGTGGGPTILGAGSGTDKANIIATNVMCTNGVVHVIDAVLLPL